MKRHKCICDKKDDNIKSLKVDDVTVLDTSLLSNNDNVDISPVSHNQYDNDVKNIPNTYNDTVSIPASELKPYSETLKQNKKSKESYLYFYCSYKLDGIVNNKYYVSTSIKSARNNIHNIALRYKKSKCYDTVEFQILEFKQISRA